MCVSIELEDTEAFQDLRVAAAEAWVVGGLELVAHKTAVVVESMVAWAAAEVKAKLQVEKQVDHKSVAVVVA